MVGIDPKEKNPLILVATLGQKGPSSFIFSPVINDGFTNKDFIQFRRDLRLTIREFSELFDISPATIYKIENNLTSGKDTLKRIEIYYRFPEVALYEVEKNGHKINDEKRRDVQEFLKSRKNSNSD